MQPQPWQHLGPYLRSLAIPETVAGSSNKVKLSFKLPYRCSFGQEICLVGSGEALGNWSVENGKRMHWTDGDVWEVDFEVSAG